MPDPTWDTLSGRFHPMVLVTPKTALDPLSSGRWPAIHPRVVIWLDRHGAGHPWSDQLALAAAVMIARHLDLATVLGYLRTAQTFLQTIFKHFRIASMAEWNAERAMRASLACEVPEVHTLEQRLRFWAVYTSISNHEQMWLRRLPDEDRRQYEAFVLPRIDPRDFKGLVPRVAAMVERKQRRKTETDAVLPHFIDIRTEAHLRFNRLMRVRAAYREALRILDEQGPSVLPLEFNVDEGGDVERGLPPCERLHFRLWDRRSFILTHRDRYSNSTVCDATSGRRTSADVRNRPFVEYVGAERLLDDAPAEGLWFADMVSRRVLGNCPVNGTVQQRHEREAWLREWGYTDENGRVYNCPLNGRVTGLLTWGISGGDERFNEDAAIKTGAVLVPIDSFTAACAMGLLAVELFTTTGMRMNECMQVPLDPECFVCLEVPAPPGAHDQTPRLRWLFRLIPKGEREDKPADYYIGSDTKKVLVTVCKLLQEHYRLQPGEPLPEVRFDVNHARAHRFGPARYVFQYSRQAIPAGGITACMRFLLHGMLFRTREGQIVLLKAHLLRHAFATHAVQVEKYPLDVVGAWLKQKNLAITDYYSQPTAGLIADATDDYLARFSTFLNAGQLIERTPEELRKLHEEARGRVGALADVVGGHCTQPGFCPAKFACVGCPANASDPAKRHQIESRLKWTLAQRKETVRQGLTLDTARFDQDIRACHTMLREMDLVERWRADEEHGRLTLLPVI